MRIALMFRTTEGPWGGGNSFLRALKKHWLLSGVEVTDKLDGDLDGVLFNSSNRGASPGQRLSPESIVRMVNSGYRSAWTQWLRLSRWNKTSSRPAFVHRLDGIYRLYGRKPDNLGDIDQLEINPNMDWTIYQSEYCRQSFLEEGTDVTRSTVILNGVDLSLFVPRDTPLGMGPFKIITVAWSPNPMKGFARTAEASRLPGVEVTFVGNWPIDIDRHEVTVVPPQNHSDLSQLLRQHHGFLHMAQNDPCSNALMEGLASGLPAVFHPSGGSPEIVKDCGIPGEPSLAKAVAELIDRYDELRQKVLDRREEFSIQHAASHYLEVFKNVGRIDLS